MGRMHCKGKGKGISRSTTPYRRRPPQWLKVTPGEVEDKVIKFARKGMSPSQIGTVLRDQHGVGKVKSVSGQKILRILKANGVAPEIPEDLYQLIKKAVTIRKHLEKFTKDKDAKHRLILTESKVHRLSRYYRQNQVLPPNWKYESATAEALVA
jgi:small subunit ribosomal protein S13e